MAKTPIAGLLRTGWDTVGRIVQRVMADHLDERRLDGLVAIGVDEISYRRGQRYLTSVANHRSGAIVWCAPGRNSATLQDFFDQLGDRRRSIRAVSIDMSGEYQRAIREAIPQAQICFDPFHVCRLASRATDQVRRDEWNAHDRSHTPTGRSRQGHPLVTAGCTRSARASRARRSPRRSRMAPPRAVSARRGPDGLELVRHHAPVLAPRNALRRLPCNADDRCAAPPTAQAPHDVVWGAGARTGAATLVDRDDADRPPRRVGEVGQEREDVVDGQSMTTSGAGGTPPARARAVRDAPALRSFRAVDRERPQQKAPR